VTAARAGAALALLAGCAASPGPDAAAPETVLPASTNFGRCAGRNVVFYNDADPAIDGTAVVALLQRQYDFLREFLGDGPGWVIVHTGNDYQCGHTMIAGPWPEMFLMAPSLLDTRADYAHEMTHCFHAQFGRLPHWFDESMADALYFESEVQLYLRRRAADMLTEFDRVDHRSYELMQLRARYGAGFFRRVYRVLTARRQECRALMQDGTALEDKNRFLLAVLSEAAGEDVVPRFVQEFGFNVRTRERQRGY